MKKILLFFSKPIVGGLLSLIGLLEILFSIPSSYITYPIPLWIIVIAIGSRYTIAIPVEAFKNLILYSTIHLIHLVGLVYISGVGLKHRTNSMFMDISLSV